MLSFRAEVCEVRSQAAQEKMTSGKKKKKIKFMCYPHESCVCVCREVTGVKIMNVISLLPLCRNSDLILGI